MDNRINRIYIRVSKHEYIAIAEKANLAGLSLSSYMRKAALGKEIREGPPSDFSTLIIQLRKTGNTLHEMLRTAQLSEVIDPIELEEAIKDNRAAEKKIANAFTKLWQ